MRGYRQFISMMIAALVLFTGLNALIWFVWVKDLVNLRGKGGDLVRIGYISGMTAPREEITDLPRSHIDIRRYDKTAVDMVTVGDSFSIGHGHGRNRYYQDYIASINDMRVLNMPSYLHTGMQFQPFQPVIWLSKLISSGYLDIMKPRYLLLESIERMAITRFTTEFTLEERSTTGEIDRYFRETLFDESETEGPELRFINNGNWKFLSSTLQYRFRDHVRGSKVLMTKLSKPLFSSPAGDRLIFYQDDINASLQATPQNVALMNRNLNRVATLLRKKGITLIFMPIVDKLDLYHPYLVTGRYPKSSFFEELRKLPKDYLFIDTKAILSPMLEKGEMDIYFQDDTHWNWKASQAVFENVRFGQGK